MTYTILYFVLSSDLLIPWLVRYHRSLVGTPKRSLIIASYSDLCASMDGGPGMASLHSENT